jgi:hypothetical protein
MRITGFLYAIALAVLFASCGAGAIVFAQTRSDGVPTFDVSRTCRSEATAAPELRAGCMADEKSAQDQLTAQWAQFSTADKTSCVQPSVDISGIRSYVELLTCLQTARDARKLPPE